MYKRQSEHVCFERRAEVLNDYLHRDAFSHRKQIISVGLKVM